MNSLFKYGTNTWVKHEPSGLEFEVTFISYNMRGFPMYSGANGQLNATNFPENELVAIPSRMHYNDSTG